MHTLQNIFEFILLKEYNIHQFERDAGLQKGILLATYELQEELNQPDIIKIAKRYKRELDDEGFVVLTSDAFGDTEGKHTFILNDSENPFDQGTHEWTDWAIDNYFRKK